MPQAAAYRNDTHTMPHREEKCSSPTSFLNTFSPKSILSQSNTSPVITHQIINVSESIKQDMACRNLGNMIWHEIAESYEGGLLAISTGKSAKRALKCDYNPIYEKAHYNAGKYFPGTIRIETINDYYNGLSNEVKQFISLPFIQLYGHNRIERYTRK